MMSHRARMAQAGSLALVFAGSGCGLILGLDDFEDAPVTADQNAGGADGSGGAGSTGGDDSAGACRPDTVERCYNGPPGTEDVGLCKAGIRACDSSGETWGTCEGEVVPQPESCASTEDENCDGYDCTLWAQAFGKEARAHSLAIGEDGSIVAAGFFADVIQFGPAPLMGAGQTDAFVVVLDRLGSHRWSRGFGDAAAQEATSVHVDASGNIIVTGINNGTMSFGGSNVGPGLFVAKFDHEGEHIWSRSFPGDVVNERQFSNWTETVRPKVKTTQHGDVIISGTFKNDIKFDESILTTNPTDAADIYIAKLNGDTGSTSATQGGWARKFGGLGSDRLIDIAIDRSDSIVLIGEHGNSIQFDNLPQLDGSGMFLTKLNRHGVPVWSRDFKNGHPAALDVDTSGNITAVGSYTGNITFGDTGSAVLPEGKTTFFVAQFNPSGEHRWSRGFEGTGHNSIADISVDTMNNIVLTGEFSRELRVDNEILDHDELPGPWVLKLDSAGKTLWKRSYRGGMSFGIATRTDPENHIIITGWFDTHLRFDTGTLETETDTFFIARLGF